MKPENLARNGRSSLGAIGPCLEPRSLTSPPGGDSVAVPAEPLAQRAKPATEPEESALPFVPTPVPLGGTVPRSSPAAETGVATPEWPALVPQPFSAFGSLSQFQDAQRMATMLARSSIVPENYRGEAHVGDCLIALDIANRIGVAVLAVMQNLQLVRGRPGWSSQFLISCVNASNRFSPLRYQLTGTRGTDSWGCIAWAFDKTGERLQSPEVTLRMAKVEGWYFRPGSKWRTLPELMLRYRSATLFTRLYAPELTMGIQTTEEVVDMSAEGNAPAVRPNFETDPDPATRNRKASSELETGGEIPMESSPPATSWNTTPQAGGGPASAATSVTIAIPSPTAEPKAPTGHYHYLKALNGLIGLSPHSESAILTYLCRRGWCDPSRTSLAAVAQQQPELIVWTHDHWNLVEQELTQLGKGVTP